MAVVSRPSPSATSEELRARRSAPRTYAFLLLGLAVTAIYASPLTPGDSIAGAIMATGLSAAAVVAIAVGMRRHRPERPGMWWVLGAGAALYTAGWIAWYVYPTAADVVLPFPSVSDALFIPAYVLFVVALAILVLRRGRGRGRLDGAIVTLGLATVSWVFLISPTVEGDQQLGDRVIAIAYPVLDLLMLACLARLAFLPAIRRPAYGLLVAAFAAALVADSAYTGTVLNGTFSYGQWYFSLWLLQWTFLGAAALHPSMRRLTRPGAETDPTLTGGRLAFLAVAALIPPMLILVDELGTDGGGGGRQVALLAGVSAVMFALVVLRMRGLLVEISEHQRVQQLKDEFTSVVSHELRTPLTSIRGSLGLMAGGAVGTMPTQAQRMLEIAVTNTDRLIRLINDILDISRMESGEVVMQPRPIPARDLVHDAVEELRGMADDAGVALQARGGTGVVHADRDRVLQTLINLISNAIKFSPEGGRVSVDAEDLGDEVLFSVRDEGRGIPAEKLQSIFGRFEQVDPSDSREKGGTGLGLAISHAIVRRHHGRIWAESTLGEGSTFFFTLPPAAEPRGLDDEMVAATGPLVLVCDDDASVREVLGALLAEHGFRVTLAASGEEVVSRAAGERPDVILLDLIMPGMSGWATLDALRASAETRSIPVVILSVLGPGEGRDARSEADADAWLVKPVDEAPLLAALERGLRREGVAQALIVEDDVDLARVLRATFEARGIRTVVCHTGAEAIDAVRGHEPDLVVLDVMLPGLDGFAVVDALRENDRLRDVPMLVYTARDLEQADRARLTLGVTDFITKGRVSPDEFEERVAALLAHVTGSRA